MAIPNTINREPTGFLSLFRAKVGGRAPSLIKDDVQPVVDVSSFLGSRIIDGAASSSTGTPPADVTITVPQDEAWQIAAVNIAVYPTAATATAEGGFAMVLADWGANSSYLIGVQMGNTAGTKVTGESQTWVPPGSFIAAPGTTFTASVLSDDLTTQTWVMRLNVTYVKLDV